MEKFIYVFSEEKKYKLISQGYVYICDCNLGRHIAYVFQNNPKSITFSEDDKNQMLFSSKMYFKG